MSVDQATTSLVKGVSRQPVVHVKLPGWLDGCAKCAHQSIYFLLGRLGTGHGIRARQAGEVLTKAVSRDEAMEVVLVIEVICVIVPAAQVRSGSREPLPLTERL